MPYPIERKLVVAISSRALFSLEEAHKVFKEKGEEEYRKYQRKHVDKILETGVAFPFIRRFLSLNNVFPEEQPIEVILLSKNDPDTGQRVFNSIKAHNLNITRAGFLTGKSPYEYIPAFNASLFLSADAGDVKTAIKAGYPAGTILQTAVKDDIKDLELRVAFDFDGVIVDDQAETVYKSSADINIFHNHEQTKSKIPLNPGPLQELFKKMAYFQKMELKREKKDKTYKRVLRTAIITARSAPSHDRVITTLRELGVFADETFFLGGIDKRRILEIMKPHIFFDDQMTHLKSAAKTIPSVHIPFGITNTQIE
jgi:5'-nucleotidase